MITVTVRQFGPDRTLRLSAPRDVPLSELLGDFIDAAEDHAFEHQLEFEDSEGWTLQLPDGSSPNGHSLEEIGVRELALYDAYQADPPFAPSENTAGPQPTVSAQPQQRDSAPPPRVRGRSSQRVVRRRAEAALPRRMGASARALHALCALSPVYNLQEARDFGANDPARFVREHRKPALRRVREAWSSTDYERLLEAMILAPAPPACQTLAVLSPKGGVGKTTITGLLSMLLSRVRRNVTLAVDANPDMSNLSAVLSHGRGIPVDELVKGMKASIAKGCAMRGMEVLGLLGIGPHGLYVAPSANDPKRGLDRESALWLYENLKTYAEVMVLDCGTGLFDDAAQAAVQTADQLVVVVDGEPETMQMVASPECQTLLRAFAGPIFLVVNKLTRRDRRRVNLGEFEQELLFAHGIVEVAYDEPAAANLSQFSWDDRPPGDWAVRIRELAALIATNWPTTSQPPNWFVQGARGGDF